MTNEEKKEAVENNAKQLKTIFGQVQEYTSAVLTDIEAQWIEEGTRFTLPEDFNEQVTIAITNLLRANGINVLEEIDLNLANKVLYSIGKGTGVLEGTIDGLLMRIPGYKAFKKGRAIGHSVGYTFEHAMYTKVKTGMVGVKDSFVSIVSKKEDKTADNNAANNSESVVNEANNEDTLQPQFVG